MALKDDFYQVFVDMNDPTKLAVYNPVENPDPSANPHDEGWYDSDGAEDITEDTIVQEGKTYYTKDTVNGDTYLATKVGDIIKQFVSDCTLTVTPSTITGSDASPSGAFSGSASVEWEITGTTITDTILEVETPSMTDDDFAQAFGDALDADTPTWTASLEGSTTVPGGGASPSVDEATISATYVSASVVLALKTAFATMKTMTAAGQDGNQVFATALATAVTAYYTSAVVQGKGATHLSDCQFQVVIS